MNRKGNAIVESAMIFPMTVLVISALIYMMIYFYGQLSNKVDMHILLRVESGEICENMYYSGRHDITMNVYKEAQQLYSTGKAEMDSTGILRHREKALSSRKYLIDEAEFVRMADVAGDVLEKNDQ